ncbi:glycosyltransferase [Luteipulveratus mongoliensis]|uniref:Glycosyl transferase family 28 C-terminal domain-containing protein n=1 Tax=Luteipulveratus mongoliensis TaxID=571913 RepID=A0A0K1JGS7_9MICO|nr:glycosyltransferase [Luteipulveratus mongoliensis]AKU15919.1 hypothetical protein VV02_08740 [Luteipulveratus mongoliensis]
MSGANGASGPTLLVASTGGHLEQLMRLRHRLRPLADEVEWVTADDPQSRSLLEGETVHFLRYVAPRHGEVMLANVPPADRLLRRGGYARVVTTGAAMALSVLLPASARRIPCHWIESSARATGPSLTGRLASRLPGMQLYAQYPSWATGRWNFQGSVFDDYTSVPAPGVAAGNIKKVVVTFGTMRTYGFRRAAEAVLRLLPEIVADNADVLWQVGYTDVSDLPIDGRQSMPAEELRAAVREADLVIAHAGVGSALTALDAGRVPVLLTRRQAYDEHVDDHQQMIADELARRDLAVSCDPDQLTVEHLMAAAGLAATRRSSSAPFTLVETPRRHR